LAPSSDLHHQFAGVREDDKRKASRKYVILLNRGLRCPTDTEPFAIPKSPQLAFAAYSLILDSAEDDRICSHDYYKGLSGI
jgi:hypothetical protein